MQHKIEVIINITRGYKFAILHQIIHAFKPLIASILASAVYSYNAILKLGHRLRPWPDTKTKHYQHSDPW